MFDLVMCWVLVLVLFSLGLCFEGCYLVFKIFRNILFGSYGRKSKIPSLIFKSDITMVVSV